MVGGRFFNWTKFRLFEQFNYWIIDSSQMIDCFCPIHPFLLIIINSKNNKKKLNRTGSLLTSFLLLFKCFRLFWSSWYFSDCCFFKCSSRWCLWRLWIISYIIPSVTLNNSLSKVFITAGTMVVVTRFRCVSNVWSNCNWLSDGNRSIIQKICRYNKTTFY